jgi:antitoxin MazE
VNTKLVAIGNSQGVRLPKAVVEACGLALNAPVAVEVRGRTIILTPTVATRTGWADAARDAAATRDDPWGALPPRNTADDDCTW